MPRTHGTRIWSLYYLLPGHLANPLTTRTTVMIVDLGLSDCADRFSSSVGRRRTPARRSSRLERGQPCER